MKNTEIKYKDDDAGGREYTIKVWRPYGAKELPGECGSLDDLIGVGLLPIRQMVDVLDETLGGKIELEVESILVEQMRRLLADLEEALYRYNDSNIWNVPKELEELFTKIESLPREILPELHKVIEPFLLADKAGAYREEGLSCEE